LLTQSTRTPGEAPFVPELRELFRGEMNEAEEGMGGKVRDNIHRTLMKITSGLYRPFYDREARGRQNI